MHPSEPIAYVSDSERGEVVDDRPRPGSGRASDARSGAGAAPLDRRKDAVDGARLRGGARRGARPGRSAPTRCSPPRHPAVPRPRRRVRSRRRARVGDLGRRNAARDLPARRRRAEGAPAGAPPQHVAFVPSHAYVDSGADGTVVAADSTATRSARPACRTARTTSPASSRRPSFGRAAVVTPSLNEGRSRVRAQRRGASRQARRSLGARRLRRRGRLRNRHGPIGVYASSKTRRSLMRTRLVACAAPVASAALAAVASAAARRRLS